MFNEDRLSISIYKIYVYIYDDRPYIANLICIYNYTCISFVIYLVLIKIELNQVAVKSR